MKKLHFIIFFLIMTTVNAQQKQDSYLITYTGQFNSLFNRGEDFRPYQAWLYIQGDQSLFTMKPLHQNSEQNNMMSIDLILDSMFTVYKDLESNSLLFEFMDLSQRSYYYADTLYPMQWNITHERKKINGAICIKAITEFKGREYISWYDSSIQVSNGPWKLGGLPGLILEAYDAEKQWHLVANVISNDAHFNFKYYKGLMNKPIQGYGGYSAHMKKLFNSIEGLMSAQQSDDCLTCETKSQLKINTWEPIY